MDFPERLEDVTAKWLSAALSQRYETTCVTNVRVGTVIGGSATKARLHIDYAREGNPHALPSTMWAKAGWTVHLPETLAMCATEALFFRDLSPVLPASFPRSFFEMVSGDGINGLVLLEDLLERGVTFGNEAGQSGDLSDDAILKVLSLQAGYHAALWQNDKLEDYPWLKPGGAILRSNVIDVYLGLWEQAEALPRFRYVPDFLRDQPRVRRALKRMQEGDLRDGNCIVHGDAHQANLYFDAQGRPGYLDWATVMRGHWAFDVTSFLVCSQSPEQRRARERKQLAYYLRELERNGVQAPTWDAAWLAHRRHAMWIFLFAFCPTAMHPEETCIRNTIRVCGAISDLDTLSALEIG